jgi:hypothetical protein
MASHPFRSAGSAPFKRFKWFRYGDDDEEEKKAKIVDRFEQQARAKAEGREFTNDWFDEIDERDGKSKNEGNLGSAGLNAPLGTTPSETDYRPFGFNHAQHYGNAPGMQAPGMQAPGMQAPGTAASSSRYGSYFDNAPGVFAYKPPATSAYVPPSAYNQDSASSSSLPVRPHNTSTSTNNNSGNTPFIPTPYVLPPIRIMRTPANPTSSFTAIYEYPGFSYTPAASKSNQQGEAQQEKPSQSKRGKGKGPKGPATNPKSADRRTTRSASHQAQSKGSSGSKQNNSSQQKSSSAKSSSSKSSATQKRNKRRRMGSKSKATATDNPPAA